MSELTTAEKEIITRLASGQKQSDIESEMGYANKVIDTYMARIRKKLKAKNAPHVVSIAYQTGIL